jgi:hypothetical protein
MKTTSKLAGVCLAGFLLIGMAVMLVTQFWRSAFHVQRPAKP